MQLHQINHSIHPPFSLHPLIHLFVNLSIFFFISSSINSFIHPSIHSFMHTFFRFLRHLLIHSSICLFTHSSAISPPRFLFKPTIYLFFFHISSLVYLHFLFLQSFLKLFHPSSFPSSLLSTLYPPPLVILVKMSK